MSMPEGWKLAPVEPTEEMCRAAESCKYASNSKRWLGGYTPENVEGLYKAMLAAAPTPPAQEKVELPKLVVYKSTSIPKDEWRNMPIDYWLRNMLENCDYHDGLVIQATLTFLEGLSPAQEDE